MSEARLAPTLVEDEAGFEALEPDWWDLWGRSPAATPFQSPAWLLAWWRVFHPGRLAAIAIRREGQLVALAPVYREDGPLGRRLLPVGIGVTDYLDLLLDPRVEGAGAALVGAVGALVPDWERWELEELGSRAAGLALPPPPGWREDGADQSACPVLDLSVAEAVPGPKRRKLRMTENRVDRRGGRVFSIGPDGVPDFLQHLIRLHGARWAARGEGGVLANDPVQRFQAAALPRLAQAGLSRLSLLEIEGRVVGCYYGLQHGPRAYAYLGGFDPDYAFESPGTLLVGRAINNAREEGAAEFHFLRGREAYKYEWGARDRWNRRRTFRRAADE